MRGGEGRGVNARGEGLREWREVERRDGRSTYCDFADVLMRVVELNECMRGMNARGGEGIECKGRGGE